MAGGCTLTYRVVVLSPRSDATDALGGVKCKERNISVSLPPTATVSHLAGHVGQELGCSDSVLSVVVKGRVIKNREAVLSSLTGCDYPVHVTINPKGGRRRPPQRGQMLMGTMTCHTLLPGKPLDVARTFKVALSEPLHMRGWLDGLASVQTLLGNSNTSDGTLCPSSDKPLRCLGVALADTCTLLANLASQLQLISNLLHNSGDRTALQKEIDSTEPSCQKMSSVLSLLSATISGYLTETGDPLPSSCAPVSTFFETSNGGMLSVSALPTVAVPPQQYLHFELGSVDRPIVSPATALHQLKEHTHTCFTYDNALMGICVTLQMLLAGLDAGAGFLMVRSRKGIDGTLQAMSNLGMDTKTLLESGRVQTMENNEYTADSPAKDRLIWAQSHCKEALRSSGCNSVHVIGELAYFPDVGASTPEQTRQKFQQQMLEYEELLTPGLYGAYPLRGICLFERAAFPPNFLTQLERSHPCVLTTV